MMRDGMNQLNEMFLFESQADSLFISLVRVKKNKVRRCTELCSCLENEC